MRLADEAGAIVCATVWRGFKDSGPPRSCRRLRSHSRDYRTADSGHANVIGLTSLLVDGDLLNDPALRGSPSTNGDLRYYGISLGGIAGAVAGKHAAVTYAVFHVGAGLGRPCWSGPANGYPLTGSWWSKSRRRAISVVVRAQPAVLGPGRPHQSCGGAAGSVGDVAGSHRGRAGREHDHPNGGPRCGRDSAHAGGGARGGPRRGGRTACRSGLRPVRPGRAIPADAVAHRSPPVPTASAPMARHAQVIAFNDWVEPGRIHHFCGDRPARRATPATTRTPD